MYPKTPEYLHSNMVRFIIQSKTIKLFILFKIYIPIWLDLLFRNLDKNIYRFLSFTFQYG